MSASEGVVRMKSFTRQETALIERLQKEGRSHIEIAKRLGVNPVEIALALRQPPTSPPQVTDAIRVATPRQVAPSPINADRRLGTPRSRDAVLIGTTDTGEAVEWEPASLPNPHLMVVGQSGFGKTYALTAITCELNRAGFPVFIIDYSSSYSPSKFPESYQRGMKVQELSVGRKGLRLNPLAIRKEDMRGPKTVAFRIEDTFSRIYHLGVQQRTLLRDVIVETYQRRGITTEEQTWGLQPPYLSDVYRNVGEIAEDEENPRHNTAASLHSHIAEFFESEVFVPSGIEFQWRDGIAARQIVILQLNGLEKKAKKVITEFLLWDLYSFMTQAGEKPLSCFVVLDEAHNLSFKEDTPVEKFVREARKFGLGAIIASQEPEDFSSAAFSNTGTKICFQVSPEGSRFFSKVAASAKMDVEEVRTVLTSLPRSRAFVIANNQGYQCTITSLGQRGF